MKRTGFSLKCEKCKRENYRKKKSKNIKKNVKLSISKYCKFCDIHTNHKETKK